MKNQNHSPYEEPESSRIYAENMRKEKEAGSEPRYLPDDDKEKLREIADMLVEKLLRTKDSMKKQTIAGWISVLNHIISRG